MIVDLHTHSNLSDGELSPDALIQLAAKRQVDCLALTDHDTVDGLAQARLAANEHNIRFINGIEFSATWMKQTFHIVGLYIDQQNSHLQQAIKINQDTRIARNEKIIAQLAKLRIDLNHLKAKNHNAVITRSHIAKAMLEKGLGKDYNSIFKRYLRAGKPGHSTTNWLSIPDVCAAIKAAGGIAILAHPLRYKITPTKLRRLLDENCPQGLHGIEILSGPTTSAQFDFIKELALLHNLYVSVGSDFHSLNQRWALPGKTLYDTQVRPVWDERD